MYNLLRKIFMSTLQFLARIITIFSIKIDTCRRIVQKRLFQKLRQIWLTSSWHLNHTEYRINVRRTTGINNLQFKKILNSEVQLQNQNICKFSNYIQISNHFHYNNMFYFDSQSCCYICPHPGIFALQFIILQSLWTCKKYS